MRPKKGILFLTKLPPPNTGQTIGSKLTLNMVESEREVELINLSFSKFKPTKRGLSLLWYDISYSLFFLAKASSLIRILAIKKPAYFYFVPGASTFGYFRDLLIIFWVRLFDKNAKVIAHIRAGDFIEVFRKKTTRQFAPWYARNIDTFIFLSKSLSVDMLEFVSEDKHMIIHNPIDQGVRLTQSEFEEKMRSANMEELRVVFISNMIVTKGYWELLKACKEVCRELPLQLKLIGHWVKNSDEKEVRDYIHEHGLNEVVEVIGPVYDRDLIKKELLWANVFSLPTYYPTEAQPRSIIEAMNAGCAILATLHASIPDYVENEVVGYLVEKRSINQLSDALKKLANAEKLRAKMIASRQAYVKGFDPEDLKKRLLNLFN